jgi:hypothetical protein
MVVETVQQLEADRRRSLHRTAHASRRRGARYAAAAWAQQENRGRDTRAQGQVPPRFTRHEHS